MAFQHKMFLNMVVKDLPASRRFFEKLGWSFNPQFSNDEAASLVISDTIYAMLHTMPSIRRFTQLEIADPSKTIEVLIAIDVESKEGVHKLVDAAIAAGGVEYQPPADHGFMFQRAFADLDGHHWEVFWMNPNHVMPQG